RALRVVRRVHLYLGLLLSPFLLLFGVTGLSFNHPKIGRGLTEERIGAAEVERVTGFRPWNADDVARRVVEALSWGEVKYTMPEGMGSVFAGWPLFVAQAGGGKEAMLVNLETGEIGLTYLPDPELPQAAPFARAELRIEGYDMGDLAARLDKLRAVRGVEARDAFRPHPQVHPEVRFVVQDQSGQRWNAIYDLGSGALSGRRADLRRAGPLVELLESIHTQHHYPLRVGATFWWALLADCTALSLIVWSFSGLVMWWQMNRLRRIGLGVLTLAAIIAFTVMGSTAREISFAPHTSQK
ncbi:MAG TPA: hypothetical protein VJT73_02325, partial [Polyangiaceae bacterium]|nr:hypothetical protein [Polyangiaceae bacterium]